MTDRRAAGQDPGDDGAPSAGPPLVRLRGVTRRYPNGTTALAGVDLVIEAGQSVAIVGRSGSGKSTLLNILGLLDVPDSGEVLIDGRPLAGGRDRDRARVRARELGFVFQRSHLVPALTVRDNVLLGLRHSDHPDAGAGQAADRALAAVGLAARAGVPARTLSGGEMQRAAIARTLVRPARLWLADEPTGNLDTAQSLEVIDLLRATAAERGAALVVVTHEPEIASRLERVVTLRDGRVVADTGDASGALRGAGAGTTTGPPAAPRWSPAGPGADAGRATAAPPRPGPATRARRLAGFVLQGVGAHRARARAGVLATALAVAMTVTGLGLTQSAAAQVTSLFDARRASQVTAELVRDDVATTAATVDTAALERFPGVAEVEHWRVHPGVSLRNGTVAAEDVDVAAVDAAPGSASDSRIRWAAAHVPGLGPDEVVLGATLADRVGVAQIDASPEVSLAGHRLRVVGVLTSSRAGPAVGLAFVSPALEAALPPSDVSQLYVTTAPGAARGVADRLPDLVDPGRAVRTTVDPVLTSDAYRGQLQQSVEVALQVLAVVAALAGLAVTTFVNVMAVGSRRAELGVRRAFGARRAEVVTLVMGECAVTAGVGAVLGLAVGFSAVMAVTAAARWQPVFDSRLLAVPVLAALLFGSVGGLPPAVAAGRVEPADAVRS